MCAHAVYEISPRNSLRWTDGKVLMMPFRTNSSKRDWNERRFKFAISVTIEYCIIGETLFITSSPPFQVLFITMNRNILFKGQWLWLSWQSSCFRYQRFMVRIQSSAKLDLYRTFVYCQLCIEKTKIKNKRPGMTHFLKKYFVY